MFRLLEERALTDETTAIRVLSLGVIVFIKDPDETLSEYENICRHVLRIIEAFPDSVKVINSGLKLIKYYSETPETHCLILEGNTVELTLNTLSTHLDEVEVLKSAVSILCNIIERLCQSEQPRHQKLIKCKLLRGELNYINYVQTIWRKGSSANFIIHKVMSKVHLP